MQEPREVDAVDFGFVKAEDSGDAPAESRDLSGVVSSIRILGVDGRSEY